MNPTCGTLYTCNENSNTVTTTGEPAEHFLNMRYRDMSNNYHTRTMSERITPRRLCALSLTALCEHVYEQNEIYLSASSHNIDVFGYHLAYLDLLVVPACIKKHIQNEIDDVISSHFNLFIEPCIKKRWPNEY